MRTRLRVLRGLLCYLQRFSPSFASRQLEIQMKCHILWTVHRIHNCKNETRKFVKYCSLVLRNWVVENGNAFECYSVWWFGRVITATRLYDHYLTTELNVKWNCIVLTQVINMFMFAVRQSSVQNTQNIFFFSYLVWFCYFYVHQTTPCASTCSTKLKWEELL